MAENPNIAVQRNPYLLPPEEQGWRGLSVPGARKRKWFTLFQNDTVLVTGLLLIPGEASVQHSHETGELSIAFTDAMRPLVTWHPPGEVHAGAAPVSEAMVPPSLEALAGMTGNPQLAEVIKQFMDEQQQLRRQLEELRKRDIAPRIIVDILFPPFKTTIQDDAYSSDVVITGQWYD